MAKFIKICVEKVAKPDVSRVLPLSKWFKTMRKSFIYVLGAVSSFSGPLSPDYGQKSRGSPGYEAAQCIGSEL